MYGVVGVDVCSVVLSFSAFLPCLLWRLPDGMAPRQSRVCQKKSDVRRNPGTSLWGSQMEVISKLGEQDLSQVANL